MCSFVSHIPFKHKSKYIWMSWSNAVRYAFRYRSLCACAVVALLAIQAVVLTFSNTNEQVSFLTIASKAFERLLPNAVDVNKGLAAVGLFLFLEISLVICACRMKTSENHESRRLGRSLPALAILYFVGFLLLCGWLQNMKFSAFWTSDCSEYAAAERLRLAKFATDLEWSKKNLVSNESVDGCVLYIAINAVPNRTQHYLSQTLGSLLRSISSEEVHEICRIEILTDSSWEELQSIAQHRLEPLVEIVYNPEDRQTPNETSQQSWQRGSVLHYLNAMERCVQRRAEYCLILDDDTLASQHWLSEVLKNIRALEQGDYGREGMHWMILKLFQPVWANLRQNWHAENLHLLLPLGLFGAIPCGLLTFCGRCRIVTPSTPSLLFWSIAGFVAALYACWVTGKANLEWIVGDATVHPHGTCHMAQANLFHKARAEASGFLQHLLSHIDGPFIDLSICDFFHRRNESMWATSPSLFQHAGLITSLYTKLGNRRCRIRTFHDGVWRSSMAKHRKSVARM